MKPCLCGHAQTDHRNYGTCAGDAPGTNTTCPCARYRKRKDDLRTRLVMAALYGLRKGDPVLNIGVGEREIRLRWGVDDDDE